MHEQAPSYEQTVVEAIPFNSSGVGLLQTAQVCGELSRWVYDPANIAVSHDADDSTQQINVPGAAEDVIPPRTFHARLRASHVVDRELGDSFGQWALWRVEGLGLVLAFRGTWDPYDAWVDLSFAPRILEGSGLGVHGGIYSVISKQREQLVSVLHKEMEQSAASSAGTSKGAGKPEPIHLTGHSLGGGYALAFLIYVLHNEGGLLPSLLEGGVFTFGAPLVIIPSSDESPHRTLARLASHACRRDVLRLPVHNFVNGMDIVPRLLGKALKLVTGPVLQPLLQSLGKFHPIVQSVVEELIGSKHVERFVPFGTFHLLVHGKLRSVNSSTHMDDFLSYSVTLLWEWLKQALQANDSRSLAPFLKCVEDHDIGLYLESMRTASSSVKPQLFLGGASNDYSITEGQSCSPLSPEGGGTLMLHQPTNTYAKHAFHEESSVVNASKSAFQQSLKQEAVNIAADMGVKVARESLDLFKSLIKDLSVGGGTGVAVMELMSASAGSVGVTVSSTVLLQGVLVLGLGYVVFKAGKALMLRQEALGELGAGQQQLAQQVQSVSTKLHDLDLVLRAAVQDIKDILGTIESAQRAGLEEILQRLTRIERSIDDLRHELPDSLVKHLEHQKMLKALDLACTKYLEVLYDQAELKNVTLTQVADLARYSEKLLASAQANLRGTTGKSPTPLGLAKRLPFLESLAVASVMLDYSRSLGGKSGMYRQMALEALDNELRAWLCCTTPYSFAVSWKDIITRYVFLRRSLWARSHLDLVVQSSSSQSSRVKSEIVYDASDLMWDDGMGLLRHLFRREQGSPVPPEERMPDFITIDTVPRVSWYLTWRALPRGSRVHNLVNGPLRVSTDELLQQIGVPDDRLQQVKEQLLADDEEVLMAVALEEFKRQAVMVMDSQLAAGREELQHHPEDTPASTAMAASSELGLRPGPFAGAWEEAHVFLGSNPWQDSSSFLSSALEAAPSDEESDDACIEQRLVVEPEPSTTIKTHSQVWSAAWSPDGLKLGLSMSDNTVVVWSLRQQREVRVFHGPSFSSIQPRVLTWSPDGSRVAAAFTLVDVPGGNMGGGGVPGAPGTSGTISTGDVTGSSSGGAWGSGWPFLGEGDGKPAMTCVVRVWDADSGEVVYDLLHSACLVLNVAWTPQVIDLDSRQVTSSSEKPSEQYVSIQKGEGGGDTPGAAGGSGGDSLQMVEVARSTVPGGGTLATAATDCVVRIWDMESGRGLLQLGEARSPENDRLSQALLWAAALPGPATAAAGFAAAMFMGKLMGSGHEKAVTSLAWNNTADRLASGSVDMTVRIWDVVNKKSGAVLKASGPVWAICWSPSGDFLTAAVNREMTKEELTARAASLPTSAGKSGTAATDGKTPKKKFKLPFKKSKKKNKAPKMLEMRPLSAAVDGALPKPSAAEAGGTCSSTPAAGRTSGPGSSNGSSDAATGDVVASVVVWDARTGGEVAVLEGPQHQIRCLSWSGDGEVLATGLDDRTVWLWERPAVEVGEGHSSSTSCIASSTHDVVPSQVVQILEGHGAAVQQAVWSPGGSYLATASGERMVRLWQRVDEV